MDTMYGAGTDPMPYIMAAYGLGGVALIGFFAWTWLSCKRLQSYLAVVQATKTQKD